MMRAGDLDPAVHKEVRFEECSGQEQAGVEENQHESRGSDDEDGCEL